MSGSVRATLADGAVAQLRRAFVKVAQATGQQQQARAQVDAAERVHEDKLQAERVAAERVLPYVHEPRELSLAEAGDVLRPYVDAVCASDRQCTSVEHARARYARTVEATSACLRELLHLLPPDAQLTVRVPVQRGAAQVDVRVRVDTTRATPAVWVGDTRVQ